MADKGIYFEPQDSYASISGFSAAAWRSGEIDVETKEDGRALRDELNAWLGDPGWPRPIPVTERLPESPKWPSDGTVVLAFVPEVNGKYGCWCEALFSIGGSWWHNSTLTEEMPTPTHWLPLPPKPEAV